MGSPPELVVVASGKVTIAGEGNVLPEDTTCTEPD